MLSGGQRQRVAIARSIISNPKVLLLDEATSALDPTAERAVQDALDRVSANKTTLIIAHKLATVKAADNIAVMTDGKVVEQGTHDELIARGGLYAAMVSSQDLGAKAGEPDLIKDEYAESECDDLEPTMSLQRTKTETGSIAAVEKLTAGTLNYSLVRCCYILFKENCRELWWYVSSGLLENTFTDFYARCYVISIIACLVAGGYYPAQAILFSRLIGVFTIQDEQYAQDRVNFFALMFFVLAITSFSAYAFIGWTCNVVGQTVTHRYRKELVERFLSFDQDFFDRPESESKKPVICLLPTNVGYM